MTLPARPWRTGLALGYLADLALGDPPRWHPVAGFGALASRLERALYRDRRSAGALQVAILVGGATALGWAVERPTRSCPVVGTVVVALATWTVLGGRSLRSEARTVASQLTRGDLPAARRQVSHLVGRDPTELDETEIARACVESCAENTSDAVVAPLFWGAVAGLPGLLGYRAVNTLDAMIGHRSPRYFRFGWAAARLDDVVNYLPARLAALLTVAAAPVVGGSPLAAVSAARRAAGQHPSPNAGVTEAAFAGALGLRLGGRNVYAGRTEDRGVLGSGRTAEVGDIARGARLSAVVSGASAALAAILAGLAQLSTPRVWVGGRTSSHQLTISPA